MILEDVQKAHGMIMQHTKGKKFQTAIMAAECFRLCVTQCLLPVYMGVYIMGSGDSIVSS